jgi:hypothetical protein
LAALALSGDGAIAGEERAEEERAEESGVWVFDVRVVRVDPSAPEGAEQPSPFPDLRGTTTRMGWRDALAALKKRGTTTILADQRLTTVDGIMAAAKSERSVPTLAVNFSDVNNTQKRAATVRTGCMLEVTPSKGLLTYRVEARWALAGQEVPETEAPPQLTASWSGTHPALGGDTLVLHYREQLLGKDTPTRAVEVYALLTGRFVAAE